MSNKEKVVYLLHDIKRLEKLVSEMLHAEVYPVSFFSHTFDLTHKVLNDLHSLEEEQVLLMQKQMEQRRQAIRAIPVSEPIRQPEIIEIPEEIIPDIMDEPETVAQTVTTEEIIVTETEEVIIIEEAETVQEEVELITETTEVEDKEEVVADTIRENTVESTDPPERQVSNEFLQTTVSTEIKIEKGGASISDLLEKKNLSDFRKAFSLNDRFYFLRELFQGKEDSMVKALEDLNRIQSLEESMEYLTDELGWDPENLQVVDFVRLLEKRFI